MTASTRHKLPRGRAARAIPAARALLLAVLVAGSVGGCGNESPPTAPPPAGTQPAPVPAQTAPEIISFVELVNEHRVSIGLGPLSWHAGVAAVAQAHSQDMVDRGFFSHVNPDGETPWDRLAEAGITYTTAGENIAFGYPAGAAVLSAWLSSPGHRANIENPNFTHHGVGLVGTYWTHVFITPTGPPAVAARK